MGKLNHASYSCVLRNYIKITCLNITILIVLFKCEQRWIGNPLIEVSSSREMSTSGSRKEKSPLCAWPSSYIYLHSREVRTNTVGSTGIWERLLLWMRVRFNFLAAWPELALKRISFLCRAAHDFTATSCISLSSRSHCQLTVCMRKCELKLLCARDKTPLCCVGGVRDTHHD